MDPVSVDTETEYTKVKFRPELGFNVNMSQNEFWHRLIFFFEEILDVLIKILPVK